jgi:predicted phosphodiesterase
MSNSGKVLKINRNEISKRLKINGLNVRSEALSLMESELLNGYPNYQSIDEFISLITNILVINCDTNWFIIDAKTAQKAIDILRESRICKTVDNQLLVKNVLTDCDNHSITNNYLHHFHQLFESLNKHKLFAQSNHKLTKIDDLITSSHDLNCIVFGFLFKDSTKISRYLIEDSSGRVPVVFTEETQWRDDIMVENSFVLIEGNYDSQEDCLHVNEIGLTPPTDINTTINVSNGLSRLGRMIVIISDIHLNDEKTINKLKALFTGYNSMVPIPDCFLFVGDFLSKQCTDVSDFKGL